MVCTGECLNYSGPCENFKSDYDPLDEYNEDCTRCSCETKPCSCNCNCLDCKLWLSLYQKPLEIHLQTCIKCISWKKQVFKDPPN